MFFAAKSHLSTQVSEKDKILLILPIVYLSG